MSNPKWACWRRGRLPSSTDLRVGYFLRKPDLFLFCVVGRNLAGGNNRNMSISYGCFFARKQ